MTDNTMEVTLPKNKYTMEFVGLHLNDREKVIQLGLSFLEDGKRILQNKDNTHWEEKLAGCHAELSRVKRATLDERRLHEAEKERICETIQTSASLHYQSELKVYREKIQRLEGELDTMGVKSRTLHERLSKEFQGILRERDTNFERKQEKAAAMAAESCRIREDKYEKKIVQLEEKVESFHKTRENMIVRGENSTFLGQDGEELTCHALTTLFPKAEIIDTHKTGGRGDFILKTAQLCCMIEAKNHKTNVGRIDVDKFYKDIESNAEFQCAIFASLKSGVVNRADFHIEFRNGKPIIFLTQVKKNLKHLRLAFLILQVLANISDANIMAKEKLDRIKHIMPVVKRRWTTLRSTLTTFHTNMNKLIDEQDSAVQEMLKAVI
jgi:hypothetical protein